MTDFVIPDVVGPIPGVRRWHAKLVNDSFVLTALAFNDTAWADGPCQATCRHDCGDVPSKPLELLTDEDVNNGLGNKHGGTPGCGIYAWRDASGFNGEYLTNGGIRPHEHEIFGSVLLWGKVWECELGYRAEYAQITSIWDTRPYNYHVNGYSFKNEPWINMVLDYGVAFLRPPQGFIDLVELANPVNWTVLEANFREAELNDYI